MKQFGFRRKVLILAVALVMAMQLVTLFPVLDAIKRDADTQAQQTVGLGGVLLEEYMHNRGEQLLTTVNVLVSDYGFKQAAAGGDHATIRSALVNHAARVGATVAALLDVDGTVLVSSAEDGGSAHAAALTALTHGESLESVAQRVVFLGGLPYQTVTVPLRAPVTVGWVMLGFPIDDALAANLRSLAGFEVSFVHLGSGGTQIIASTLPRDVRVNALTGLDPTRQDAQQAGTDDQVYLSLLRPFLDGASQVQVALQLPMQDATASYRSIRNILLLITSIALLLAISGSFWLANTVTRPVHNLVAAARRMREGVYTEPIDVSSKDELGELAGSFNAMQHAIADRERHIFHQAHHDSLTALPNRELTISHLRDALEGAQTLSVVSLALDRLGGIVSSLGHRAGDEVIKLAAGLLRNRIAEGHILGHFSASEFVIGLRGFNAEQAAEWVGYQADLLRTGVRLGGANISLQATAGIACYPEHSRDAAELCRRASSARTDALLRHEAVSVYRLGQEDRWLQQIKIVGDFPHAVKNDELRLAFQPKIDCRTREVYGAETLVRWQHPTLGLLFPDSFIGSIEQAGAIAHLTRWALREAVARCAAWRSQGVQLTIAVNMSVDDLSDEYLPYYLLDLVKQHRLEPKEITLEARSAIIQRAQVARRSSLRSRARVPHRDRRLWDRAVGARAVEAATGGRAEDRQVFRHEHDGPPRRGDRARDDRPGPPTGSQRRCRRRRERGNARPAGRTRLRIRAGLSHRQAARASGPTHLARTMACRQSKQRRTLRTPHRAPRLGHDGHEGPLAATTCPRFAVRRSCAFHAHRSHGSRQDSVDAAGSPPSRRARVSRARRIVVASFGSGARRGARERAARTRRRFSLRAAGLLGHGRRRRRDHRLCVSNAALQRWRHGPAVGGHRTAHRSRKRPTQPCRIQRPEPTVSAVANAWVERHGGSWSIQARQRLLSLAAAPPSGPGAGTLRLASRDDTALAQSWGAAASLDSGIAQLDGRFCLRLLGAKRLYFWVDDQPRCMLGVLRETPRSVALSIVYTPAAYRGKGYATAAIRALQELLRERGVQAAYLYIDPANDAARALSQKLGATLVHDEVDVGWR
jgi:diguanylate cyclase (GGDEF)-like protein